MRRSLIQRMHMLLCDTPAVAAGVGGADTVCNSMNIHLCLRETNLNTNTNTLRAGGVASSDHVSLD
jgi:hypothetical protein